MAEAFVRQPLSLFFYTEAIPVSPNGFDSREFRTDFVELVPQAVDVDRHRRQFAQGIEMPDHLKEVLLGEDLVGMTGQEQEQVEFFASQIDFCFSPEYLMAFDENTQIADLDIRLVVIGIL